MTDDESTTTHDEIEPQTFALPQAGGSYLRLPDGSLIRNEPPAASPTDDQ